MSYSSIQKNNTRGLRRKVAKNLTNSDMWVVVRLDKDGIHLDCPNPDHIALLGEFFKSSPELLEAVNQYAKE